jgi:acylphosphatase
MSRLGIASLLLLNFLSVAVIAGETVVVDEKAKTVTVTGAFAKQAVYDVLKGALEYVVTGKGGKEYETVFTVDCTPEALHQALLKAGFQPGEPAKEGDPPRGQGVLITAEYEADGKPVRRPVDEFLISIKTHQPLTPGPWIFTGSAKGFDPTTNKEMLQAYLSKNLVGLHWVDATPLLQNPRSECKQQNIYKANLPALAKPGTPVRLIFARMAAQVPEGTKRVHVFVTGRVQGVGFRNFTEREAKVLRLTGFVKNLADGRVEAVVEGPADKVAALLEKLKVGPRSAQVEKLDAKDETPEGDFAQFEVRF